MNNKKVETDYSFPIKKKVRVFSIVAFFLGFFLYFPFILKVENIIKDTITSNPACPISFESSKLEFFLPKIILKNVNVSSSCLNGQSLNIDELKLTFKGPSFIPFGVRFTLYTNIDNNPIEADLGVGFTGSLAVKIDDNQIKFSTLKKFVPTLNLEGTVKINALVRASTKGLDDLKLSLSSSNFRLPSQTISAFKLPRIRFNTLSIKASKQDKKSILDLQEFFIGDQASLIRSKFSGEIHIDERSFLDSKLQLDGELGFDDKFLADYGLIKMFMEEYNKKDSFYQVKLRGTLNSPSLTN